MIKLGGIIASRVFGKRACRSLCAKVPDRESLVRILGLKTFTNDEIQRSFDDLKTPGKEEIDLEGIKKISLKFQEMNPHSNEQEIVERIVQEINPQQTEKITFSIYEKSVKSMGETMNSRVWNLVPSFLLVGLSSGMILPCLPLLVQQASLSSREFGLIIAAAGVAKFLGNIPASYFVEKFGRKPIFNSGIFATAFGITTLGLVTSIHNSLAFPLTFGSRLLTGFGLSTITTSGNMIVSDISNQLNRVKTLTPLLISMQSGRAIGPLLGGVFLSHFGLSMTYYSVGTSLAVVALMNQTILVETKIAEQPTGQPSGQEHDHVSKVSQQAIIENIKKFYLLFKTSPNYQELLLINFLYWFTISGSLLTLFPLHLVSEGVALDGQHIGYVFAGLNTMTILASYPIAYIADKYPDHKAKMTVFGCLLVSSSVWILPYGVSVEEFLLALLPLAIGSTIMQTIPPTNIMNLFGQNDRSSALAIFMTLGDLGIICGSITSGFVAGHLSIPSTMQTQSGLLLGLLGLTKIIKTFRKQHNS